MFIEFLEEGLGIGKKFYLSFFILILLLIVVNIFGFGYGYSEGERSGDIYKFSKKGIFVKSWEGEMYLGGYHSTGGKSPTIETDKFYFSIPENEENIKSGLIEHIKECSKKREICTINYTEWVNNPFLLQDSSYTAK